MLGPIVVVCLCELAAGAGAGARLDRADTTTRTLNVKIPDDILEDAALKVPGLIRKYGYPVEEHRLTTDDGYILTMHRVPHPPPRGGQAHADRPVVFVMHGLLSSSADWILMGPDKGFAYILAEEGYDVWLGNARGNRYSRRHATLDPDLSTAFWDFSWDEIGNIDLPAMIDYALEWTNRTRLHYIGHSQGTTSFFVMCSLRPEWNQKIISMNALAPVAYMAHSGIPLMRAIAPFSTAIEVLGKLVGTGEALSVSNSRLMRWAGEHACRDGATTQHICANILFLVGGWNEGEFNKTMLPVIVSHSPAGASLRQLAHYAQNMVGQDFRRFDHGRRNIRVYGTFDAPRYDLSKVNAPVFLHYSLSDPFAHVKDVERLSRNIRNLKAKIVVPMNTFSHLDFVWGIHAKKLVYEQVILNMKRMHETVLDLNDKYPVELHHSIQ